MLLTEHDLSAAVEPAFVADSRAVVFQGDCQDFMRQMPSGQMQLVVTSPPYNLGKAYERRVHLDRYLQWQEAVIADCVRVLADRGSICWQVGNFVSQGEVVPLDIVLYPFFVKHGLKLRNRIVWHFEHGLHCSKRLSGRHETILWFTKSDDYHFDLDPVRVPQKYPGKRHFKGPKLGQLSGNPLGKNPGDVWVFPNVKNNHVEKTSHPCQFPVELVDRLVLSLTQPGDWVFDPFLGAGTAVASAVMRGRRGCGSEMLPEYVAIARERAALALRGALPVRPMNRPVFDASKTTVSAPPAHWRPQSEAAAWRQGTLDEDVQAAQQSLT